MGYNPDAIKPTMTIEQGPWQQFFDQLPNLLYEFKKMNWDAREKQAQRDWQAQENKRARDHEESMVFLADKLEDENILDQQVFDLEKTATSLGIIDLIHHTPGSDQTIEELKVSKQDQKSMIQEQVSLFQAGLSSGNKADSITPDGFISDDEKTQIVNSLFPDQDAPEAFLRGLNAWTLDPTKLSALKTEALGRELTKKQMEEMNIKLSFLPQSLQQDLESGDLKMDIDRKTLLMMDSQRRVVDQSYDMNVQNMAMNEFKMKEMRNSIASDEYELNKTLQDQLQVSVEETLVNNIEAQTAIGAKALSSIIIKHNGTATPLIQIFSTPPDDPNYDKMQSALKERRNLQTKHISSDLQMMYEAFSVGKGEEMLPDYNLVIDKLSGIRDLGNWYNSQFLVENMHLFREYANQKGIEVGNIYDMLTTGKQWGHVSPTGFYNFISEEISPTELLKLKKINAWQGTGIFDDLDILERAVAVNNQYKELNNMNENLYLLRTQYGLGTVGSMYNDMEVDSMLFPFTIPNTQKDTDIYNVFQSNTNNKNEDIK